MLLFAGLLMRILAFGMLVVPAFGLKFNFTQVQQCGPVVTAFTGANISSVPASLSILPLNSTALAVPLQNPALFSSGISVSFLPLAAGTNFLASLDDAEGNSLIAVSDLIRVLPSGDSSCVPSADSYAPRRFSIGPTVAQCEDLTINYDTSVVSKAPAVRLYTPRGVSFPLGPKSDDPGLGIATYTLIADRGIEILLLIDDGANIRETSPLLPVAGDASSDTTCLKRNTTTATTTTSNTNSTTSNVAVGGLDDTLVVSKSVIIGGATAGAVVFLIAIAMVIFVVKDRRKRRGLQRMQSDPSSVEKALDNEKPGPAAGMPLQRPPQPRNATTRVNPIYTTNSFLSLGNSKETDDGWTVVPREQINPAYTVSSSLPMSKPQIQVVSPSTPERPDRRSLETLDIEGMLNLAMSQSENPPASRTNSYVSILGPIMRVPSPTVTVPSPTFLRSETSRRQLRDIPSDVPRGPASMAFSGYSVNPFDSQDAIFQEPLRTGDSFRSPAGGLPRSPRDSTVNRTRVFSGASGRTSSDWYGIAR